MTTPTETPTPRTDAVAFDVNISTALDCSLYAECVRADEMRTLERQLTALTAQDNHCRDCCCARSWKALGITEYTGKSIPEHIAELKSQLTAATAQLEEWKQHAAESDKEFNQLEDWLIGNADWDEKGLINRAEKCKERIRDLIASEAQLEEARKALGILVAAVERISERGGPVYSNDRWAIGKATTALAAMQQKEGK